MAALSGVDENNFDFEGLANCLISELPSYARPIFLRFTPELEITGTFKHKKVFSSSFSSSSQETKANMEFFSIR